MMQCAENQIMEILEINSGVVADYTDFLVIKFGDRQICLYLCRQKDIEFAIRSQLLFHCLEIRQSFPLTSKDQRVSQPFKNYNVLPIGRGRDMWISIFGSGAWRCLRQDCIPVSLRLFLAETPGAEQRHPSLLV